MFRLLALAVVLGLVGIARAQPIDIDLPSETVARVIASGGVGGRFARPVCRHGVSLTPANAALYTYALQREARAPDHPMVLDTGGLLAPHGVARYAAVSDPAALAELIDSLGYRALAFGEGELAAPRESLLEVLRRLRERQVPSIATNLRCEDPSSPLCEVLVDGSDGPSVHAVHGRSMAVLSFLSPDASTRVAPDRVEGVRIEPFETSVPRAVRAARRGSVEVVIAVIAASGAEALDFAAQLEEDARPDLLLLAGSGDLLFARPATVVPAIASPPAGDAVEVLVRAGLLRDGYEMVAQPLGGRGIDVARPVTAFTERIGPSYCQEWGRALPGGRLARELPPDELAQLVARILQEDAHADIAILNRTAVDDNWRPAHEDALTASDVYIGLEYDEPLFVADVPASWVNEVAHAASEHGLVTAGVEFDGSNTEVLDHPIQARGRYRVVTLRFLANGGDRALPPLPRGSTWEPLGERTIRSVVLDHFQRREARDPREALPDLRDLPEWVAQGTIDGTFSGASVTNPSCTNAMGMPVKCYDAALLNRANSMTLGLEVNLRLDATATNWTWENMGVLRYRSQWTPNATGAGAGSIVEAVDQLQVRTTGSYRGLRQGSSDWYVPDPIVEVFVESELSVPAGRDWHWFLYRPTLGARFPLTNELELKFNVGIQGQAFAPSTVQESTPQFGLGGTLTLKPWDILRFGERHATLQTLIDFFYLNPGNAGAQGLQNRLQLRGSFDGSFDLAGPLSLVVGVRLYVQQDDGRQVGVALDGTAGFRLGWLGRSVFF